MSISIILLAVSSHLIISQEENNTILKSNSSASISSSGSWEEIYFDHGPLYYDTEFEIVHATEKERDDFLNKLLKIKQLAQDSNFSDNEDSSDEDDN